MRRIISYFLVLCLMLACTEMEVKSPLEESAGLINIVGDIDGVITTKVDEYGFCDKDYVGIYIVDYEGDTPGELLNSGNRADNVMFTYDDATGKWKPAYDIYWKDSRTHIDVYGYYPFGEPGDVGNYDFELEGDQRKAAEYDKLGGYEASDFLWGKAEDNAPTASTIRLGFRHKMAGVRVTLNKGLGFTDEEWATAQKQVVVTNTTRKSVINLRTGEVRAVGDPVVAGTIPMKVGDDFRAIVVPQTVPGGKTLISITIDGVSYYFKKSEDFTYIPSRQHNFTITVSKRNETGEYEFSLADESITVWEEDPVSHDSDAREYVIVNVETPGTLEERLCAEGKNPAKVKNLKVTGKITSKDFATFKYHMPMLTSLNLKEVKIVAGGGGNLDDGNGYRNTEDDMIPDYAMPDCPSLMRIILPDELKKIGFESFYGCSFLSGSLIIPEGVTQIGYGAFRGCCFTGDLILPSTLEHIEGQAFLGNKFHCELKLPESLKVIDEEVFYDCDKFFGRLILPSHLEKLGYGAFYDCRGINGDLVIPQTIKNIKFKTFGEYRSAINGTLVLHDGIEAIGSNAFHNAGFRGELILPKNLTIIHDDAFSGNDFSGKLVIPKTVMAIGSNAFSGNWRLSGTITIGKEIQSIGNNAFDGCRGLEGVIFEDGLEVIGSEAFHNCFGIGRIICKSEIPPIVLPGAFDGVPKDNFVLEVPESALQQYQTAEGWCEFKRISASRELVVRPSIATALNTSTTRSLILDAEGDWDVESQPDWVSLDRAEGNGKCGLTLTFSEMPAGSEDRAGEIVFKLKDKDYRTRCKVTQYDYEYGEDEFIRLQTATKGKGIDIVLLGDGYDAEDISKGELASNINEACEHFFNVEPYRTYRDYFNVTTAVSVSAESGIGGVNSIVNNKFNTSSKGGVTLGGRNGGSDYKNIIDYVSGHMPNINLDRTLVIMIPNTREYSGITYMWDEGFAISYCPISIYDYPFDFRGVIQHEAGGHGFGKLGDEYIYHNTFIDACRCICCPHVAEFNEAKGKGWYDNLSLSGKMSEVPWSHLIFHERYKSFVDIFEGGFMHNRGVYRSEQNSCMNNNVPYYSTVSRESIVKRIMEYAGEEYSFEKFLGNDSFDASSQASTVIGTKSEYIIPAPGTRSCHEPEFMGSLKELER